MIQSVIKNILLIILKLKYEPLIEYMCGLPSLAYFSFISCRIKDILLLISKENNYEQYKNYQEDIVDEILFIQDIFCLKIDKINHILINSLFNYCILPYVVNINYDEIKIDIKLYFINVLFNSIQDESFLNILFTILFFPSLITEMNAFIKNPAIPPDNYFYNWSEQNNNIQLSSQNIYNYIKYNFNKKTIKYIFSLKNSKFPEFSIILEKYKNKPVDKDEIVQKEIINEILNNFSSEEKNKIYDFQKNLSIGTGVNCLLNEKHEKEKDICDKCFKNIIEKFYVIFLDKSLELRNKLIDNNIKSYLFSLISIKNNNKIILMICLLIRNILIKNNDKISEILQKSAKIINGNNISDKEVNYIMNINKNNNILNSILINEQFHEIEDDDDDEEEDYNKRIENNEKKKLITEEENEKLKKSIIFSNNSNQTYDKQYFDNAEKIIYNKSQNQIKNNTESDNPNLYYLNTNLIEQFIDLLNIKNNLNPVIFKCITDIILSLISKKKENNIIIIFCSSIIKTKVEKIYTDFKNYIINNYKNNQNFHLYAYNKFKNQYATFLSLMNYDYDNLIKEGYLILNKNLLNFNFENTNKDIFLENIIFGKKGENKNDIINNNIINFYLIHDLYYIISNESNNNIENDLFINNYSLKFDELVINKQYFLYDLNSKIKYFPCKCKINKNHNISNNYFDSTLLLYENNIYVGNSSSNPNYTRIIDKYSISNCSLDKNSQNSVELYIIDNDDTSNYFEINLIFSDYQMAEKIINIVNEEIKLSRQNEKKKFKEFLHKLK